MFILPLLKPYNYCHIHFLDITKKISHVCFDGQLHNKKWVFYHIDIVILEFHETSKVAMIVQPKTLFVHFDLCHKVVVYVKDECTNLNTLTNALTNIVSCISLM